MGAVYENVVNIVDIDVDVSGMPFLVMELVDGEPLSAKKARFGDPRFAREVVRQVAAGLSALHEAGIVHRDLKPANVLLERQESDLFCAKIVDFGIARVSTAHAANRAESRGVLGTDGFIPFVQGETGETGTDETQLAGAALTRTGWLLGTPLYMAPELASGVKDAPASSDLWSLGVVAYEIGCGKLPFVEPPVHWTGESEWKLRVDMQLLAQPLRGVVERCLDVDPLRRPTAAEVAAALT
jgi:serine/threonine-protein kinase